MMFVMMTGRYIAKDYNYRLLPIYTSYRIKSLKVLSNSISEGQFSGNMSLNLPNIGMFGMHASFAHSMCVVSKCQGHINYLGLDI